jgi:1,4-alpha-glucan branching enzyme
LGRKETNGFKKQYLKSRAACKVTFSLPKEAAPTANKVSLVGEFSNWNKGSNQMKLNKNGKFTTTLELEKGRDYRFRYLVDENQWMNDWHADKYVQNPYGGEDSVVSV